MIAENRFEISNALNAKAASIRQENVSSPGKEHQNSQSPPSASPLTRQYGNAADSNTEQNQYLLKKIEETVDEGNSPYATFKLPYKLSPINVRKATPKGVGGVLMQNRGINRSRVQYANSSLRGASELYSTQHIVRNNVKNVSHLVNSDINHTNIMAESMNIIENVKPMPI